MKNKWWRKFNLFMGNIFWERALTRSEIFIERFVSPIDTVRERALTIEIETNKSALCDLYTDSHDICDSMKTYSDNVKTTLFKKRLFRNGGSSMETNAIKICKRLQDAGYEAYFVGGCIRDKELGRPIKDIDITTNATPEEVQKLFPKHINTGLQHGTVSVKIGNSEYYEVTTYRIDGKYSDGRHPENVKFVTNIKDDLSRRDFTINAIAYDPLKDKIMDPFHGINDLKIKIINAVGSPKDRFMEDPLRVLRAMRFAIKLGFTIDVDTKIAMHDNEVKAKLKECISKERITEELRQMLTCGNDICDVFMEFSDVITTIIPEMEVVIDAKHNNPWHRHDIYEHMLCVTDLCKTDKFVIKLAALLHDIGKPICRTHDEEKNCDHFVGHPKESHRICVDIINNDLRLSKAESKEVLLLIENHDMEIKPTTNSMRKFIVNYSEEFVRDWVILKEADLADHQAAPGREDRWAEINGRFDNFKNNLEDVIKNLNALKISDLEINGNDVMKLLGINPGPKIGEILKSLFEEVVAGNIENERNVLIKYLKENYE